MTPKGTPIQSSGCHVEEQDTKTDALDRFTIQHHESGHAPRNYVGTYQVEIYRRLEFTTIIIMDIS